MTTNTPNPPLIPLEIRLRTLEAQILGIPSASSSASAASLNEAPSHGRGLSRRVNEISEGLEHAISGSEVLKSFVQGYAAYLPLLTLHPSEDQTSDSEGVGAATKPSDLLSDSAKIAMILESYGDIVDLEQGLREVEIYKKRGVEGAGDLEGLLLYKKDLIDGFGVSQTRSKELEIARKEVSALLKRYNEFTSTVSELFLELHHRFEGMEDAVSLLERKKRKELAGRY